MAIASENNWEPAWVGVESLEWTKVPGTDVSIQVQKGQPLQILRAWIADHHAFIEPVRDQDTASYTPTNSVSTSNHLNGTAADVNWNSHPFRVKGTFTPQQMKTLRELLDFYEDTIYWGGDWQDPIDEMHWQLGYETYGNPHTQDFINRKIRPDGFSTFRRGDAPAVDAVSVLSRATGLTPNRAAEILPAVLEGLKASECTNVNRIAMWLAQVGHESGSFQYTEEIAKNGRYAPYIGRTWIQITWDYNYRSFGQWAKSKGYVADEDYFVDNPQALADLKWAGIGAAWYWTVARPQINQLSDGGDLLAVTRAINGGTNGIEDRNRRFKLASDLGDQLLALVETSGDDMAAVPQEQWDRVYRELTQLHESLSGYRTPGEGKIGTWTTIDRNKDKMLHELYVETRALRDGDLDSIGRIVAAAAGRGADQSPEFIAHAQAVLMRLETENQAALQAYVSKGTR